jgi:hypothetical protein
LRGKFQQFLKYSSTNKYQFNESNESLELFKKEVLNADKVSVPKPGPQPVIQPVCKPPVIHPIPQVEEEKIIQSDPVFAEAAVPLGNLDKSDPQTISP